MVAGGGWDVLTRKMFHPQKIEVVPDSSYLAERAAEEFIELADKALRSQRRFSVALAGGSIPRLMYTKLSQAHLRWDRVHFFWGDERCVPADHDDSNFHMAYQALLKSISIPGENIHRIHGELPVEQAAKNYEGDLRCFFGRKEPRFNLILLGLGSDGHTASLFPGTIEVPEKSHWVAPVIHRVPPSPLVDRVTLTLPVLNTAAHILFLVSGGEKAVCLAKVLQGPFRPDLLPAQAVKPVKGNIYWLVDQAAATMLHPGNSNK